MVVVVVVVLLLGWVGCWLVGELVGLFGFVRWGGVGNLGWGAD